MLSALNQYLNGYIIRNQAAIHQLTQEIILQLRCRREAHLDLLEAQFHQKVEHLHLLRHNHGLNQCLVAVSQIHAAPVRSLLNLLVRPGTLREM